MTYRLAGKTVFITGAARGIGEHIARRVVARGGRPFLAGLESERMSALAAEIDAPWFECDVTDQAGLDAAAAHAVEQTGGIDVVVANAGIANMGTVAVSPADALVRTVDVNLNGVIRTVCATLPHVVARNGYVLLMSSTAAFTAMPGMAAYCASKAGVEQFGNVLRLETDHLGVRVGTAHPIWVDTDMVRDAQADLATFRGALRKLPWPLNRTVPVGECAESIVRGIEGRKRRVYVPKAIGGVQAIRTLVLGPVGDLAIRRQGRSQIPQMEAEVRALGRSFGEHSVENWHG